MFKRPTPQWLIYALASGACAALNGVFAKLTTTQLTTTWATAISHLFGFDEPSRVVELLFRGFFFLMNLAFNAVMWGLFTRALTLASSTVRVSVMNTSANFMITAVLGALIFKEALPGVWWLGASLLVAGSVIIGRREEKNLSSPATDSSIGIVDNGTTGAVGTDVTSTGSRTESGRYRDAYEPDAPLADAGDSGKADGGYGDIELLDNNRVSGVVGIEGQAGNVRARSPNFQQR
ncbi:hypothetical protein K431DRAFT_284743 [Polychaeton citri CBS 116435]|uniref:EamA domain-containing protein n=1 Tax=Polychaeton citri CBS 116435 TaxID=1314669 RepID=A0A9P4Q6M9_9PEZI|nr:hypothetical protein K431DRAFT_284743 [Polychaeton citri CBS 116435]